MNSNNEPTIDQRIRLQLLVNPISTRCNWQQAVTTEKMFRAKTRLLKDAEWIRSINKI